MSSEYFPNELGEKMLNNIMDKIKAEGRGKEYDCMVGVSGGLDSSYVVYLGYKYGLRMLAVHIDDGLDTEVSVRNINNLCEKARVRIVSIKPHLDQYKDLTRSFFLARVPNLAMPQDNLLKAALNDTAKKYNLRYRLSGANFALECILERSMGINPFDRKHIIAVHKQFGKGNIDKLRIAGFYEAYIHNRYFNQSINVLPLNMIDYNLKNALTQLSIFCDYNYYGGKHYESILTRFLQCYYLPVKYGIDKRKSHFSSMIISGQMTRAEALAQLSKDSYINNELKEYDFNFMADYLGMTREEFDNLMDLPPKQHQDYPLSSINNFAGLARKFRKYLG